MTLSIGALKIVERDVHFAVFLIDQHAVALRKRSSANILPADSNVVTFSKSIQLFKLNIQYCQSQSIIRFYKILIVSREPINIPGKGSVS